MIQGRRTRAEVELAPFLFATVPMAAELSEPGGPTVQMSK